MVDAIERAPTDKSEEAPNFARPLIDLSKFDDIINAAGKPGEQQKPALPGESKPGRFAPGLNSPAGEAKPGPFAPGAGPAGEIKAGPAKPEASKPTDIGKSPLQFLPALPGFPRVEINPAKPGAESQSPPKPEPRLQRPGIQQNKPFDTNPVLPRFDLPPGPVFPGRVDAPRPAEQPKPELQNKAGDQDLRKLSIGPDGKIELTEKDFDLIGPKAKDILKQAGVEKIKITPGKDADTYEMELKKPLEIPQDPDKDGCRTLKIADRVKADVVKNADGSFELRDIQGLSAEKKILFKWRDADVHKVILRKGADGQSEVSSTGSWNGISREETRSKPPEVFEKASVLFERMGKLKESLEAPKR